MSNSIQECERPGSVLSKLQKWIVGASILIALGIRFFVAFQDHQPPVHDALEYDQFAMRLVYGEGYRNEQGQLSAWRAPLYPVFLAVIYKLTGHNFLQARLAQAALSGLTVFLIFQWARLFFGNESACWAGFVAAVYPPFLGSQFGSTALISETLYTFLLTFSLYALYVHLRYSSLVAAFVSGTAFGLAVLTKPVCLLLAVFLPVILAVSGYSFRRLRHFFTIFWFLIILTLLPWGIRNYVVFHDFVPVSTMGGINFYFPNHPGADGMGGTKGEKEARLFQNYFHTQDEWLDAAGKSEVEKSKFFFRKGMEFVKSQPWDFVKLCFWKALIFLNPRTSIWKDGFYSRGLNWGYFFVLAGALASWVLVRTDFQNKRTLLSLFLIFGYFVFIHAIFISLERYRLPAEPILIVASSLAFGILGGKIFEWTRTHFAKMSFLKLKA